MTKDYIFPDGFLWGGAHSAYQTEGNNFNNDWYEFEQVKGNIKNGDKCGESANHYELYDQDHKLFRKLNHNTLRTGIEWSRIVPNESEVNEEELEHYHKVFESLKKNQLEGFVTLYHFTIPLWFERKGGFLKTKNLKYFEEYCEIISKNFPEVKFWNPINEPGVVPLMSYFYGEFPPGKKSLLAYAKVYRNMMKAHALAYRSLKKHNPQSQVGIVKSFPYFYQKDHGKYWERKVTSALDYAYNQVAVDATIKGQVPFIPFAYKKWLKDTSDYFGVNYYNAVYFKFRFGIPVGMETKTPDDKEITQLGYGIYPEGLYENIMRIKRVYKGPIYVSENGIGTLDDNLRQRFILKHLFEVHRAIENGADVKGYFYWSTIDNWEWAEGFEPRFGMIGIDYKTQERHIKDSAKMFAEIANKNKIEAIITDKILKQN
ncbi:MAG: glycoside hydrolase family 1 protein [Candidatus Heimdallarchaeaceae archaeon]